MTEDASGRPVPTTALLLVCGLTLFDTTATLLSVGMLGGRELNPLLLPLIDHVGLGWTMALRTVVGLAGAGLLALLAPHPGNRWGARPLGWVAVALGALACWHLTQLALYLV